MIEIILKSENNIEKHNKDFLFSVFFFFLKMSKFGRLFKEMNTKYSKLSKDNVRYNSRYE